MSATCTNEQLVIDHLSLASQLSRKFQGRGVEFADLEQVARLGLVKAAERFDTDRGDFAPFAAATIRGELKRYFRDKAWGVRPPRPLQDLQARIHREFVGEVTAANAHEVADQLGVAVEDVRAASAARGCFSPDSIDAAREAGHDMGGLDPDLDRVDEWVTFGAICRDLDDDDRQLLTWRFVEERTQQDIADLIGISQMQVSRRLKKLIERLRAAAGPAPAAA